MIRLVFHSGPRAGSEIATSAAAIRLGRNPEFSDVVLADPSCSQKHCKLERTPQGFYQIEDVGSSHGTYVNKKKIQRALLQPGDRFTVGESEIEVGEGRPRLFVVRGKMAGVEVPIGVDAITIGAARDNVLCLPAGEGVDRYHAMLLCLPTGFAVQDNRSSGPTLVNGQKVDRYLLVDGDVITIGDNDIRFLVGERESAAALRASPVATTAAGPRAKVVFVSGPHEGHEVALGDKPVVFGRRGDCTMVLSDPTASGQHCKLEWTGKVYKLSEIKATYGTYVNGQKIAGPVELATGDVIGIGQSVLELRLLGGTLEQGIEASVIAEGAYTLAAKPKFVVDGHVIARDKIAIGRAPGSDIFLEDEGISRLHAEIRWDGQGFLVVDKSKAGTYLGGRRIVEERLQDGHVLKIGEHLFNVLVRGERCQLERIDAATALAAIEVQREAQKRLSKLQLQSAGADGYKTMFKLDVADVEAMVAERKARHVKKGAPMWKPTTDIQPRTRMVVAVVSSLVGAALVCGYFLFSRESSAALLNHPLAEAHASKAFVATAVKVGRSSSCQACHASGQGVPDKNCVSCHAGVKPQTKHQLACTGCHVEHRGEKRGAQLGATLTCKDAGCHPSAHAKELAVARADAPIVLKAPAMTSMDLSQVDLHLRHAKIEGRCVGCHGSKEGKPVDAKKSCFRCHVGGAELATTQCRSCHTEHSGAPALASFDPAMLVPASTPPAPARSARTAGALAFAVFTPLLLLGLVLRLRARRRAEELVAELAAIPAESFKRLVHSINVDKCVGCSMCVTACPASVLELVNHKSTIVNFDACIQCKKCETACNFDALRMHDADKPPPMVEMPDVDAHNETPVAGLFLIGQAAGNPQIKNAANTGRRVVEFIAGTLRPGSAAALGAHVDVLVVGAGPGGLSAAISCVEKGFSFGVLEKGTTFAGTQANYYFKGKHVMAEPNDVKNVSRLPVFDADREKILTAWQEAIVQHQLPIRYGENVVDVKKDGEVFVVRTQDAAGQPIGEYRALRVVLAIGTMANPRKLGCPGDHLPKVKNALVDPEEFVGKNIVVVGGGDAGIEVALALGAANKVWLSVRGPGPDRIKPSNRKRLDEAIAQGVVQARFATSAAEVKEGKFVLKHADGRLEELENDVVFAMIGGLPPQKWLQSVGVPYVNKPHSWSPGRSDLGMP